MISKARWILTKGTWLGQTLFSTLVKWESSLFVTWKCCKAAKRKKFTYRLVEVFSSCYLHSHKRLGNFRSSIKNTNRNLAGKNHLSSLALMLISQNFSLSRELLHENGKGKVHLPFRRGVFEGLFFVTIFTLRLGLGTFNRVLHPKPSPSSNWMRSSIQIKSLVDGHVKC